MNEQAINDIKNSLREMMALLVQRGEPLSDDLKIRITAAIEHAANRITELRQLEMSQGEETPELEEAEAEQAEVANEIAPSVPPVPPSGGNIPPLDAAPHESSNINAFRYEPESGKLYVKFQGKYPAQNGPVYSYDNVPAHIYDVFRRGAVAPKTSGRNAWHTWKQGVAPSHGASMYALIKQGGYSYSRLS